MANLLDVLTIATTVMGVIMSFAYFLQARTIWKNKSSKNISIPMFTIFCIGVTLWLLYGIAINSIPLIIVNAIAIIGSYTVFALTLKFRKRK